MPAMTAVTYTSRLSAVAAVIVVACTTIVWAPGSLFADIGEAGASTLTFPSGARTNGMGEVGTALADDPSALFFNPAGLGINSPRLHSTTTTAFYQPLLPAFKLPQLWHGHLGFASQVQRNTGPYGFAFDYSYVSMGEHVLTDELGRPLGRSRAWDLVAAARLGWSLGHTPFGPRASGISVKYVHSVRGSGIGPSSEGIGRTFAVDAGWIRPISPGVRAGLTLANMGPPVRYVSREDADPLPFSVNAAIAFTNNRHTGTSPFVNFRSELRASRQFVKNHLDKRPDPFFLAIYTDWKDESTRANLSEIQYSAGTEWTVANVLSYRIGVLVDKVGRRYELHWGLGYHTPGGWGIDWYYIHAPEGSPRFLPAHKAATGARNGQWGVSATHSVGRLIRR